MGAGHPRATLERGRSRAAAAADFRRQGVFNEDSPSTSLLAEGPARPDSMGFLPAAAEAPAFQLAGGHLQLVLPKRGQRPTEF